MVLPHLRCSAVSGGATRLTQLPAGNPLLGGCHPAGLQGSVCLADDRAADMHQGAGAILARRQWLKGSGLWQAGGRWCGMHENVTAKQQLAAVQGSPASTKVSLEPGGHTMSALCSSLG